jgi:hypothetical protein
MPAPKRTRIAVTASIIFDAPVLQLQVTPDSPHLFQDRFINHQLEVTVSCLPAPAPISPKA